MASKCASKTLFVGNLHASLEETDLLEIFKPFGRIVECCKRWCHYGFIQFATEDEARLAYNALNGSRVRGRPMRIEFQRKKIRNLAALLEAEAQTKHNLNIHFTIGDDGTITTNTHSTSPLQYHFYDDNNENILSNSFQPFSFPSVKSGDNFQNQQNEMENFKFNLNFTQQSEAESLIQKSDTQLVSQFAFMDTFRHSQVPTAQPLGTRNLNILNAQQQQQIVPDLQKTSSTTSLDDLIAENSIAKDIANSVLLSSSKKPSKPDVDSQSTSWFNYLLDRASQYPTVQSYQQQQTKRGIFKSNANDTSLTVSSSSSSPRSPIGHLHRYANEQISPKSTATCADTSIVLYRSLNTSNTIFVQPTDILEPLEIGEFNEYKLFPQSNSKEEFYTFNTMMSSPKHSKDDFVVELTPPSSVSLSSTTSSSSSSSLSSSNDTSPVCSKIQTIKTIKRRLVSEKLFSEH